MKINGVFFSFLNEVGTGNRFRYSTYMLHCKGARTSGLPQTEEVTSKPLCRHWASKHRCTGYLVLTFRLIPGCFTGILRHYSQYCGAGLFCLVKLEPKLEGGLIDSGFTQENNSCSPSMEKFIVERKKLKINRWSQVFLSVLRMQNAAM